MIDKKLLQIRYFHPKTHKKHTFSLKEHLYYQSKCMFVSDSIKICGLFLVVILRFVKEQEYFAYKRKSYETNVLNVYY